MIAPGPVVGMTVSAAPGQPRSNWLSADDLFMSVTAYAFLASYQAYYLLDKIGSAPGRRSAADISRHTHPVCRHNRRRSSLSIAPAIASAILALGGGSYGVLYAVAGLCAVIGASAVLPVKRVR